MVYVSDKRLYRTQDGDVVPEGHPDAAFLLVPEGGMLSDEDAERYGLKGGAKPDMKSDLEMARDRLAAAERRGAFVEAEAHRNAIATLEARERMTAEQRKGARRAAAPLVTDVADEEDAEAKSVAGPPENKAMAPKASDKK